MSIEKPLYSTNTDMSNEPPKQEPYKVEPVFSAHDGGWYCEVWRLRDGVTIAITDTFTDKQHAITAAHRLMDNPYADRETTLTPVKPRD